METIACTVCGKTMCVDDEVYTTSSGTVTDLGVFGYIIASEKGNAPFYTVACEDCGDLISEKIDELVGKLYKKGGN